MYAADCSKASLASLDSDGTEGQWVLPTLEGAMNPRFNIIAKQRLEQYVITVIDPRSAQVLVTLVPNLIRIFTSL